MKKIITFSSLTLSLLLLTVGNANAGTTSWQWDLAPGSSECSSACSSTSATSFDGNGNSNTANMSGFADTNGGGNDTGLQQGNLHYYSGGGWGLVNRDENGSSPQHAFDNIGSEKSGSTQVASDYADYDMALVSFDTSVALTEINFGYIGNDADFSVVAFTGDTFNTAQYSTWSNVASSGDWTTVGHYDAGNTGYYSINSSNTSSQFWLIGAYNSIFSGALESEGRLVEGNDSFKIKKLRGTSQDEPEPPTEVNSPATFGVMLMGLAFIGMRQRRKNQLS